MDPWRRKEAGQEELGIQCIVLQSGRVFPEAGDCLMVGQSVSNSPKNLQL